MTRRLIESWLPIAEIGVESLRERTPMTPFPAPNRLHVWWARRPLIASRAAVLASLLPEDVDHDKFLHLLGIHGDPVESRKKIDNARRRGERFEGEAYSYSRAFTYNPTIEEKDWIKNQLSQLNIKNPTVLDPTAGGGSIPFEAIRIGTDVFANDLNPIASLILKATIEFPKKFGNDLVKKFDEIAKEFVLRKEKNLKEYFPNEPEEGAVATNYIWARTIICPYCSGKVPLSPNWKLSKNGIGLKLIPNEKSKCCDFEIVHNSKDYSIGTVKRGDGSCPYANCGRIINGDEIKVQAKSGKMGNQLVCIVYKKPINSYTKTGKLRTKWELNYRTQNKNDNNLEFILKKLEEKSIEWEAWDIIPSENIENGHKTSEPLRYGFKKWKDLFNPRQLICHGTSVEIFQNLLKEYQNTNRLDDITKAGFVYLSFSIDRMLDYSSYLSIWISLREVTGHTFTQHAFPFKWSYVEMSPLTEVLGKDWTIEQTKKCINELVKLGGWTDKEDDLNLFSSSQEFQNSQKENEKEVNISCNSADDLSHINGKSIDAIIIDPPYYDNVMYSELSDFFYVWQKRTSGHIFPQLFRRNLTDKISEAVANPILFSDQKGSRKLAGANYQSKMSEIFKECTRVLKDDGIMTLMFTHKATGAWDALTKGLLDAGFIVTASWPVNTEASGSLHIKDKAAANSTILLVCRPREEFTEGKLDYWEDVEQSVKKAVRRKVEEFQQAGINGVDLYLSCFGPALEEFSKHWPLQRGNPKENPILKQKQQSLIADEYDPYEVTTEDALEAARKEVKQWRMENLMRSKRQTELDSLTEWFVLAWDAFKSPQFPYDEGLRLARVVGIDLDTEIVGKIAEKKTSNLIIWDSVRRAAKGTLGPADGSRSILDALHHAANRARNMNLESARELLEESGVSKQPNFEASLLAVLEVLPVSSTFTKIEDTAGPVADAASDFDVLEHLRRLAFSEKVPEPEQLSLWK